MGFFIIRRVGKHTDFRADLALMPVYFVPLWIRQTRSPIGPWLVAAPEQCFLRHSFSSMTKRRLFV